MAKNPALKSRKPDNPYLIICDYRSAWVYRVLKFWQADGRKEYGRAFCAVASPMTYGSDDLGDVYVADLRTQVRRGAAVFSDDLDPDQIATLLGVTALDLPHVRPLADFENPLA